LLTTQQLIDKTLASFKAERQHDIVGNDKLIHADFAVTDMVLTESQEVLPRLSGKKLRQTIGKAFQIGGREFIFKTIVASESTQTVIVEFIESYPEPSTHRVYRTPQVAICEFKADKLYRTRHYMDPRLSFEYLAQAVIEKAFE
jgi:hypothetical protein